MVELSHSQLVALTIIPKVAAGLSLIASFYVIFDILQQKFREGKKLTTYQRLLLGMSFFDLTMSSGFFIGNWAMPVESGAWGALGTIQTCEVTGFLGQTGVGQAIYNATLSTYYVLTIRYAWRPQRIEKKAEPYLHALPIAVALATSFAGIPLKLYNYGLFDCWIAPSPLDCIQSYQTADGEVTNCERGDNAFVYQWAFHVAWVFSSAAVVTINMFLVYYAVLKQEESNDKYLTRGQQKKREKSKAVAIQSYFFVFAMYATWTPVFVARFFQLVNLEATFGMFVSIAVAVPMQGCWNALAYLRPKYLMWRKRRRRMKGLSARSSTAITSSVRSSVRYSSTALTVEAANAAATAAATAEANNNQSMRRSTIKAIATGVIMGESVDEKESDEFRDEEMGFASSDDSCDFYDDEDDDNHERRKRPSQALIQRLGASLSSSLRLDDEIVRTSERRGSTGSAEAPPSTTPTHDTPAPAPSSASENNSIATSNIHHNADPTMDGMREQDDAPVSDEFHDEEERNPTRRRSSSQSLRQRMVDTSCSSHHSHSDGLMLESVHEERDLDFYFL